LARGIPMKLALVTGGARGIGAAICRRLAKDGYAVAVNYFGSETEARVLQEEIYTLGGYAILLRANIESDIDNFGLISRVVKLPDVAPISVLVNNAAVNVVREFDKTGFLEIDRIFNVNARAAAKLSAQAISLMKGRGGGSIVNVTSEAARFGGTNMAAYAASKAAMNTLTIALAREVAPYGIRVNAVSPGVIDTEMTRDFSNMASLPMGRKGTPDEVANVVSWLCSPEASYVSGAIIPVAGGR
jgi:NAD(P)-dependent dehydrogenase (short-subunit alcohol dehydrogenase family)